MIVPITYPSAGNFWLNPKSRRLLHYSINNRNLTDLPEHDDFSVTSENASEIAAFLGIKKPLDLVAPHNRFIRQGPNCIVRARAIPYSPGSFVRIKWKQYDIYIASPELCFLQAAHFLDLTELIRLGYDLCSTFYADEKAEFGQISHPLFTSASLLRDYVKSNHGFYGASKARKALRYVRDNSNSPMETNLAMFISMPEDLGGCGLSQFEMNKIITLTGKARLITGYPELKGDLVFPKARIVLEYNSNLVHLNAKTYTDDMSRITALMLSGWKCFPITSVIAKNYFFLVSIINIIRDEMSMPALEFNDSKREGLFFTLLNAPILP